MYQTTLKRVFFALFIGELLGAVLTTAFFGHSFIFRQDGNYISEYEINFLLLVFIFSGLIWFAGLIVAAAPCWGILHKYNLRSWKSAASLGAVLSYLTMLGILSHFFGLNSIGTKNSMSATDSGGLTSVNWVLTPHGWFVALQQSLIICPVGIFVALIIWKIAYKKIVCALSYKKI